MFGVLILLRRNFRKQQFQDTRRYSTSARF